MHTKDTGLLAELLVKTDLVNRGYYVSTVEGDNAPYDLIVDRNGSLERVQVKGRTPKDGALNVELYRTHYSPRVEGSNNRVKRVYYSLTDTDWFAIVNITTQMVYYIKATELDGLGMIKLRVVPSKNNQQKGVRLAEHYTQI